MNKHQCEYCSWYTEEGDGLGKCEAPQVMRDYSCRKACERKLKEENKYE